MDINRRNDSEVQPGRGIVVHVTPDQGWAWIISIACAFINGITFGLIRSYGVLFFKLLETYELSREDASWPFSLCTTFTHLSGPVAGLLLSVVSLRVIVFTGSLIAAFAMMLCFFANTLIEIIIYIGIVQGFGIGLSFMQTPVIIAQYFYKYRATATAISYAGGTIGSFLFPPLLEYILAEYGLNGCFLIIGGIMLNALPFALLLRPATPREHKGTETVDKLFKGMHKQLYLKTELKKSSPLIQLRRSYDSTKIRNRNRLHSVLVNHMCVCHHKDFYEPRIWSEKRVSVTKAMIENEEQVECGFDKLYEMRSFMSDYECVCIKKQNHFEDLMEETLNDKACQTELKRSAFRTNLLLIHSVITNPLYLILCITHVSFQWAWMTYQMIIIDFAMDRGMSTTRAVILLSSFAVADLFGRIASGLVADKRLVRKRNIVSVCILLIGVLIFMTPVATTFRIMLVMTIALGFVSGSIIVLFSILTMEYVGLRRLPIALGTSALTVGITTLFRPIVIGYFRDTLHTYDTLFHFIGILALLAAVLWLSEPFAGLWVTRRRKYGYGFKVSVI